MIYKTTGPSDWEKLAEDVAAVALVKVARDGRLRGEDRKDFLKRADHVFLDCLDNIKIADGEHALHVIPLGCTEGYGPNRNGDGFTSPTMRARHSTFEKFAKWYRDHRNKDPRKNYGRVVKSAFNEPMRRPELIVALSGTKRAAEANGGLVADRELDKLDRGENLMVSMSCFTDPAYPILTRDRGYVGIEAVEVGDYVYTHEGRWRRVTAVRRRKYTGTVYRFKVNGLPLPIELTADHPMLARAFSGSREALAVASKARRYFKDPAAFAESPPDWCHACHLQAGDRFFYRAIANYPGYGAIADADLAAVMGYYLAEGSLGYNGERACTVSFACNMADSLPRRLPKLMERMYPDVTVKLRPHRASKVGLVADVYNTELGEFLRSTVGVGSKTKVIPPEIFNADREVKLAFLGTWLDGDGFADKKGVHWSTANRGLALQGRDLLASIGVPASIYRIDHSSQERAYGISQKTIEYTLNVSHLDSLPLAETSDKVRDYGYTPPANPRTKPAAMRPCGGGLYGLRISEVASREVADCQTYNVEVDEDESFSAAGLISHNCKVPFDKCSYCGNEAPTRASYCESTDRGGRCKAGGCKRNLGKAVKVAGRTHHLHVDNPLTKDGKDGPTFFDISDIATRQADMIALATTADWLQKAAAEAGVAAPDGVTGPWTDAVAGVAKLAGGMAMLADLDPDPAALRAFDPSVAAPAGLDERDPLLAEKLAALADLGVVLGPAEFARLFGTPAACPNKQAFLRLTRDDLPDLVDAFPVDLLSAEPSPVARDFAAAKSAYACTPSASALRAAKQAAAGRPVPAPAEGSESAAAVAYALYKCAALWRRAAAGDDLMLTVRAALAQNRVCG